MVLLTRNGAINNGITSKNKVLVIILTGILFLLLPVLIVIIDPIHVIVNYKLRLSKGSTLYELLQQEIRAARLSIYMFNITNADKFLCGEDEKVKVEEVGPFVFQEYRWYEDLELSKDGKTMEMTPKIRSEFVPEASLAHPKDINLTLANLPMLCYTAMMSNYPSFLQHLFNVMTSQLGAKAIINVDVHNYLWGYEQPLVSIVNSLAPGLVYFDRVGLLDRLYDNGSDYRVIVGATDQDRFKIKSVKKFTRFHKGTVNDVDERELNFEDTYEGIGYPPMLTPDIPINLYRLGLCKILQMEYTGSKTMDYGGEGFVYAMSNNTFMSGIDPITLKPYPDGLMDISSCFYGLPYVVSKGHFLDTDPRLLERIDGLNPDRNVHVNEMVIDRKAGVTYDTKMSLQLSVALDDVKFNSETRPLSNLVLPIVHVKLDQPKMSEGTMSKFLLVYKIAPEIVMCLVIMLLFIGLALISYTIRLIYVNWVSIRYKKRMVFQNQYDNNFNRSEQSCHHNLL